jgi:hypothetical protein
MKKVFLLAISVSLGVTGCSSTSTTASGNLACSSIEQYLADKALALKSAAEGGSAEDLIKTTVGGLSAGIDSDPVAKEIHDKYFDSMILWSQSVDRYVVLRNEDDLRNAASELEKTIDELVPMCEDIGWKFQQGWR